MTASELAFLIGALCGSVLTWLVACGEVNMWRKRCEDWMSRLVRVKQELERLKRDSGESWKDGNERN